MTEETFRWVVAAGVLIASASILVLAISGMVMFRVASRLQKRIDTMVDRYEPMLDTARRLVDDLAPKISRISTNIEHIAADAEDIAGVAKDQAHRFAEVGRDIADRTKAQVARVDAAVDETVDKVQHAGENLKAAAVKPVKEASAVLAGMRAAVSAYGHQRRTDREHIPQDEEMFI